MYLLEKEIILEMCRTCAFWIKEKCVVPEEEQFGEGECCHVYVKKEDKEDLWK